MITIVTPIISLETFSFLSWTHLFYEWKSYAELFVFSDRISSRDYIGRNEEIDFNVTLSKICGSFFQRSLWKLISQLWNIYSAIE